MLMFHDDLLDFVFRRLYDVLKFFAQSKLSREVIAGPGVSFYVAKSSGRFDLENVTWVGLLVGLDVV